MGKPANSICRFKSVFQCKIKKKKTKCKVSKNTFLILGWVDVKPSKTNETKETTSFKFPRSGCSSSHQTSIIGDYTCTISGKYVQYLC